MVSLVDGALHHLGKPGGFHLLVAVLLCCNFFPITFHHMSMIFYEDSIPHTCRLPEGWPWHKKFSIPKVTNGIQSKYDECHMFVDPNSAKLGTKSCVYGWEFYPQGREWTIIAEWGLVCEREYLVTLAAVVYHGGVMFGGLVFGTLADKFGRKPLMLFTLYAQTAISIGIYFVQNFILFVILRFVHGLLLQGLQCSTICLVMELLPMRYRTAAGMGCSIVWGLGLISLSLVSYSVQHWRFIQLAISLPCIVTFLYIWLIPESVRWLLTVQKTEKAMVEAHKFEQFNKRPLGENFSKDVETATKHVSSDAGQVESYGMRELLLQGSKLRISSLVLCFCWFATSSLYHGLSIMLLKVGSNRYTSTVIIGSVDLMAFIVMYFLLVRFGRKRPICALLVLCGAVCISTVVAENLEIGHTLEVYVVSTVLTLVERSCAAACLAGLTICAAELFPTVIRTFGIGVCLFCGQFGWLMAPQILKLSQLSLKALPWIIFGILSLLAGLLVLLLPETLTKALPDTLEDMENFESRKAAIKSKDKEAVSTPPTYGQDWATTYKQKIEEANVNLDGSEDHKEVTEKRWYTRNYSRRSAKVVRFYGLDPGDDPCQDGKSGKKQGIRMVRFSFESEETARIRTAPSCAPVSVGRFSAIQEEPELETALDEAATDGCPDEEEKDGAPPPKVGDGCPGGVVPKTDTTLEQKSRFLVQRVQDTPSGVTEADGEGDAGPRDCEKQSRFVVQHVPEPEKLSRFLVQPVADKAAPAPPDNASGAAEPLLEGKPSRFVVQQVADVLAPLDGVSAAGEPVLEVRPSRFAVQRVADKLTFNGLGGSGAAEPLLDGKPSRFIVQKVAEKGSESLPEKATSNGLVTPADGGTEAVEGKPLPFLVHRVADKLIPNGLGRLGAAEPLLDGKPSRFIVQRVAEKVPSNGLVAPPGGGSGAADGKPSRFVVQRVGEKAASNGLLAPSNGGSEATDGKPSRFVVQRVGEEATSNGLVAPSNGGSEATDGKPSRFVVQRVAEKAASNGLVAPPDCGSEAVEGKPSRFVVRRVSLDLKQQATCDRKGENCAAVANLPPSRFLVQRVTDDVLKVVNLNNNNNISNNNIHNNNNYNNDQKMAVEKSYAHQGPYNNKDERENMLLKSGNSSLGTAELNHEGKISLQPAKNHPNSVDIAVITNS